MLYGLRRLREKIMSLLVSVLVCSSRRSSLDGDHFNWHASEFQVFHCPSNYDTLGLRTFSGLRVTTVTFGFWESIFRLEVNKKESFPSTSFATICGRDLYVVFGDLSCLERKPPESVLVDLTLREFHGVRVLRRREFSRHPRRKRWKG